MTPTSLRNFGRFPQHFALTGATALFFALVFALAVVATPAVQSQTFTVIHHFTDGGDGAYPISGLTIDAAGGFYGTTFGGGSAGFGTIFRLKYSGSGWTLTPIYGFAGGNDGASPWGRVTIAQDGTLYGTTYQGTVDGCNGDGCGTAFHLTSSPGIPKSALAYWEEGVLYRFTGGSDGGAPQGDIIFDQLGNIYGTTVFGGGSGCGVIYELTPSGDGWTETVLYSAQNNGDGCGPFGGVLADRLGNLYGVFVGGGPHGYGSVYELSPSGSSWTEQTVYGFSGGADGGLPAAGLILDAYGNLYGTTRTGGTGGGTVFELTPVDGGWRFKTIYAFGNAYPGDGPWDKLVMDDAGNLYGTTWAGGAYLQGSVFELTPSQGGWKYTSLHDFTDGGDGALPRSSIVFDTNGNLYGTASVAGAYGYGVVWEITP